MINHKILFCDDCQIESDSMIDLIKKGLSQFNREIPIDPCIDIVEDLATPLAKSLEDVGDYSLLLLDALWGETEPRGIEIARKVRDSYPKLPIIIISSRVKPEHFKDLIPLHISGYFNKGDRNDIGWAKQILDIIKFTYEDSSGQPLYQKLSQVLASSSRPWRADKVKKSAASVWQNSNSYTKWQDFWVPWTGIMANKKVNLTISKMKEFFKDEELFTLSAQSSMREHLNHVLYVYFTGYVISHSIAEFKTFALSATKKIIDEENSNLSDDECWDLFQFAWLICATLHDTTYPLEVLPSIYKKCSGIMELCKFATFNKKSLGNLNAKKTNWDEEPRFNKAFKTTFTHLSGDQRMSTNKTKWLKNNVIYKKKSSNFNHGIASAMLFLSRVKTWEGIVADNRDIAVKFNDWTATAMALHAMKKNDNASKYPIRLTEDPLSFLLALCDELQIWNRNRPDDIKPNKIRQVDLQDLDITGNTISATINYVPYKGLDEETKNKVEAAIGDKINEDHKEIAAYLKPEPFKINIYNYIRSWDVELPPIKLGVQADTI